ncbi:UDP-N-acetylmuramoyl-L-alanine--D-glutamate ligase [Thermosulfuriphilus sp.]
MELQGKKIVIVGLGRSGMAAAKLAVSKGAEVLVSERRSLEAIETKEKEFVEQLGVFLETGGHREETFSWADMIVVSPGVDPRGKAFDEARRRGIPLVGELELATSFLKTPMVAITGTNGKTTVTALVGDMLRLSGRKVFIGGNFGIPLSEYVSSPQMADVVVVEVSSFQLETIHDFRPQVAVLLNITPDHLERYSSFEDYARTKFRLFENQGPENIAIVNGADPEILRHLSGIRAQVFIYGPSQGSVAYLKEPLAVLKLPGGDEFYDLSLFRPLGRHNRENFLAAALAARLSGASPEGISETIRSFVGYPHRLEFVTQVGGVYFVNDSKATNVDATVKALEGLEGPIVLIAGGKDKGGSYLPLVELVRHKVKALILMGEAREKMAQDLGTITETYQVESLEEAVEVAMSLANPGDTVLLSPACASFDQFESYKERGQIFRSLVFELAPQIIAPKGGLENREVIYH